MSVTRLEYLTLLIKAGWGSIPQDRLPRDVIDTAALGNLPRTAPWGVDDLRAELEPKRVIEIRPAWSTADTIKARFERKRAAKREYRRAHFG